MMQISKFTTGPQSTVERLNQVIDAITRLSNVVGDGVINVNQTPAGVAVALDIDQLIARMPKTSGGDAVKFGKVKTTWASGNTVTVYPYNMATSTADTSTEITTYVFLPSGSSPNHISLSANDIIPYFQYYDAGTLKAFAFAHTPVEVDGTTITYESGKLTCNISASGAVAGEAITLTTTTETNDTVNVNYGDGLEVNGSNELVPTLGKGIELAGTSTDEITAKLGDGLWFSGVSEDEIAVNYGDGLTVESGELKGVRVAYLKSDVRGSSNTAQAFLDTDTTGTEVTVTFYGDMASLDKSFPCLGDGDVILVSYKLGIGWYCLLAANQPQVRIAYCKTDASTGTTIQAFLDTDTTGTEIQINCLGDFTDLQDASPALTDGMAIPVFKTPVADATEANYYCTFGFHGAAADGIHKAYCKTAAGTGTTLACYLDTDTTGTEITVNFSIINGSNLNESALELNDGDLIFVQKFGNDWYCITPVDSTEDCS